MMVQGEQSPVLTGAHLKRAKAVLAAAVAWVDRLRVDALLSADEENLRTAVAKYKAVMAVKLPEDATAFFCPHCDAEKPAYGWHYNAGDTGPFFVAYLTCYCGQCKNVLSVAVTQFVPSKELAESLMQQFKSRLVPPA